MKEYPALVKLFANGKVTIPIEIREKLGLKDGELLEIKIAKTEKDATGDTVA
jgi:AbrB family looped-hinge helix DNA binding protein